MPPPLAPPLAPMKKIAETEGRSSKPEMVCVEESPYEVKRSKIDGKKKIFSTPEKTVTEKRDGSSPTGVSKFGKVDSKYFKDKKMDLDDIVIEEGLLPIHSSTPTPSVGGTIVAGNLDVSCVEAGDVPIESPDKEHNRSNDSVSSYDSVDAMLEPFTKKIKNYKKKDSTSVNLDEEDTDENKGNERKQSREKTDGSGEMDKTIGNATLCNKWIGTNQGISTKNDDSPPSIYREHGSKSSLDLTSISQQLHKERDVKEKVSKESGQQKIAKETKFV